MPEPVTMARRRFSFLMFLNYATQGGFLPLLSLRLEELHFTPAEMGWAFATQPLAALVSPLVVGQVADRYVPAQRCLSACAILAGALLWLFAGLEGSLAVFVAGLAIWLVLGPANLLCASLSFSHLADPEKDFGPVRLWGTIGWAASGWAVGFWLSLPGWLSTWFPGWELPVAARMSDIFRLAGLLAFALGGYALTLPHTAPQKSRGSSWLAPLAALRNLRGRSVRIFWICSFGVCVTLPFMMQLAPLFLIQRGIPREWMGPTMTLAQSMEVVSLALLPMLLLRLGIRGTMVLGLLAWAGLMGALTLGDPLGLVIPCLSLNGLCICCFIVTGQVFVNSRAKGDVRASAQALLVFVNSLGLLAGHLLVGEVRRLAEQEFQPTFAVGAVITVVLVGVFLLGFQEHEHQPEAQAR